jgi:hypothetical protein
VHAGKQYMKKNIFCILKDTEGSGSISQRYGSAGPDPHKNVTDPQHCLRVEKWNLRLTWTCTGWEACPAAPGRSGACSGARSNSSPVIKPKVIMLSKRVHFISWLQHGKNINSQTHKQCSGYVGYVFKPPGSASESAIYLYVSGSGFGSFHQQAKKWRKTLISTFLWLLYYFLFLKNDV